MEKSTQPNGLNYCRLHPRSIKSGFLGWVMSNDKVLLKCDLGPRLINMQLGLCEGVTVLCIWIKHEKQHCSQSLSNYMVKKTIKNQAKYTVFMSVLQIFGQRHHILHRWPPLRAWILQSLFPWHFQVSPSVHILTLVYSKNLVVYPLNLGFSRMFSSGPAVALTSEEQNQTASPLVLETNSCSPRRGQIYLPTKARGIYHALPVALTLGSAPSFASDSPCFLGQSHLILSWS
jgi:hypothetical protein